MKTLLLAASLIAATGAVAAPDAPATLTVPAVALSPYEQLTQTARAQFDAQDWQKLQKTLERALPLASTPQEKSDSWRRLSGALFQQGLYADSREAAQKVFALGVASPQQQLETRTFVVSGYVNEKNWPEARRASAEILADPLTPDDSKGQARFALGLSYDGLGEDAKAREQFALVGADQTTATFFREAAPLFLGKSYQKSQQWDEARQQFEAVTKIKDISGDLLIGAYQGLGEVAEKQNRTEDAKVAFAQARSLLMQQADGQFNAKDWEGAIASYKTAIATGIPEPHIELVAHMQLGTAYQTLKDYDAAIAEYQYVIDTNPDTTNKMQSVALKTIKPLALFGLAKCYIAQKKFEPARGALDKFMGYADDLPALLFRKEAEGLLKSLPPKQ